MDGKVIIYGFCLALVVAGSFFWQYTMQIDDADKELRLARQQMTAVEDGVRLAKGWLTARKEAAALISAAGVIEKGNKALRDEVEALRKKKGEVSKVFASSLQRARQETAGMEFPELQLSSGVRYKQVKVQSVDESLTVLQHAEGVSKVPTSALPADLLDRLRFGFVPGNSSPSEASGGSSEGRSKGASTRGKPQGRGLAGPGGMSRAAAGGSASS